MAFVAEFIGFGSGEMKENMGKYQKALEEMNNASVEYVRGMSVVKAFNQTASSFKKLKEAKMCIRDRANIDRILELDKEQEEANERREKEAEQR